VQLVRDPDALQLLRRASLVTGTAVSDLVSILNPGVVAIGGQLSAIGDPLFAGIREVVYRSALPVATRNLRVMLSALFERDGVFGLAELVADRVYLPDEINKLASPS
jgi:predicted NBD/HSP70 family sugar kinase